VPVQALSKLLRGLFRALVRQERPDLSIPESVWARGGVVDGQPAIQGPEKVLNYWGRDVHRIALTNSRLLSIEAGHICFRYRDSQAQRWQTMTLPADEFIRRFLLHVLPKGFHRIRHYGLLASAGCKANTARARELIAAAEPPAKPATAHDTAEADGTAAERCPPCPCCGGRMIIVEFFERGSAPRGPPSCDAEIGT
jgi:hypothetical protein